MSWVERHKNDRHKWSTYTTSLYILILQESSSPPATERTAVMAPEGSSFKKKWKVHKKQEFGTFPYRKETQFYDSWRDIWSAPSYCFRFYLAFNALRRLKETRYPLERLPRIADHHIVFISSRVENVSNPLRDAKQGRSMADCPPNRGTVGGRSRYHSLGSPPASFPALPLGLSSQVERLYWIPKMRFRDKSDKTVQFSNTSHCSANTVCAALSWQGGTPWSSLSRRVSLPSLLCLPSSYHQKTRSLHFECIYVIWLSRRLPFVYCLFCFGLFCASRAPGACPDGYTGFSTREGSVAAGYLKC